MAHEAQVRYSDMVLAKVRAENKLKNGVVFNNDYEGQPAAGVVKIPVRDTEVAVSDYDKANGITAGMGGTSYENFPINKDKAVNEIIDGYDAGVVPDNLVADRLDSAGYAIARVEDNDGASVLLAGATKQNISALAVDNIYSAIVDVRKDMSKANIPDDGRRYLLITPDAYALVLKSPEFVNASALGNTVAQDGIVGRIAGFNVIEWNDSTAGLAFIAGHPRFATRAEGFAVPVKLQDLSGSGKYIGASAVQGRIVYGHKVLRQAAIRAVFSPAHLVGTVTKADDGIKIAVTAGNTGTTYAYRVNPAERAVYGMTESEYGGKALTSGTTVVKASAGDIAEVANLDSGKVVSVGYFTV